MYRFLYAPPVFETVKDLLCRKQELLRGVEAGRTARSVGQRNTWVGNRTFLEARSVVGEEGC